MFKKLYNYTPNFKLMLTFASRITANYFPGFLSSCHTFLVFQKLRK